MFDDINDLYQQVILDHCKQPRNFHEMPAATCSAQGHNPLCGDRVTVFMKIDGDRISAVDVYKRQGYKYGFVTDIEADEAPPGLDEGTVRFISAKKNEPAWLLEWRLKSFRRWLRMTPPNWAKLAIAPIDYQASTYYCLLYTSRCV